MTDFASPLAALTALAVQSVGTGAGSLQLPTQSCRILVIQADQANSGTVYLGSDATVNASGPVKAYAAMKAGDMRIFEVNNANLVWASASAAAQKLLVGYA